MPQHTRRPRAALRALVLAVVVSALCAASTSTAASNGLVAAYSFDESSGTIAHDSSGNGNDATLHNASFTPAGKFGSAVSLNGTSSLVTVPDDPSLDVTGGLTIEAWVRATSFAPSQTVVAKERPGGGFPYGFELDNGVATAYASASSSGHASSSSALPLRTWQFVAMTYDGSTMSLYIGGSLVATAPLSGALATSNGQLSIGGDSVWGEYFAGRIDNVRIYNRGLTAAQLQSDMNTAVTSSTSPAPVFSPVAAYAFDEGTGMTATDSSGSGNTATLNGATWSAAGKYNGAVSFGSASIVTASDAASVDASTGVTVEAWVYPTSFSASQTLVAKEQPGGGFPYGLELDNGVPNAYATTSSASPRAAAGSPLPLNAWSFVAATYNGSALTVYVNGSVASSVPASGAIVASTGTLSIGADQQWGEHFAGLIDNVRVYAAAVDAATLANDMATAVPGSAGSPPPPPPPADTTPPSTPTGLATSNVSQTALTLSWNASTDNTGVAGYDVYVNGVKRTATSGTSLAVSGLTCGTTYTLGVDAYDAAGNTSAKASIAATTSACSSPPPTSSSANLWIDKTGGSCTRSATPAGYSDAAACGSFQSALNAAQPGDTVLVTCNSGASCTYPPETLSGNRGSSANVTIAAAQGFTVSFEETAGSGAYVWLSNLRYVTFQNIGFGRNNSADSSPNLRIDCTRNVTLINSSGRRFYMFEGNANVTFQGGDWGNYSSAGEEDSTMGTTGAYGPAETCPGDASPQPQRNIVFDGVTWHDVFWISSCSVVNGGQCSQWGGSHPDCFEINGYVDGVTVKNSTFYHCGNTMLSLYTDQGKIDNVVVQNNTFRDMAPWSYFGIQWVTTANFTCSGDKFLNNTYTPNAPNGWIANTPPRFECASGGTPTEVAGNTIQSAPPSTSCTASKASPNLTYWHNNTFSSGSC